MIKLYSTNCPKCKILIKKLQDAKINFDLIENLDEILEASNKFNIQEAPFIVVNDEILYNFPNAIRAISGGGF